MLTGRLVYLRPATTGDVEALTTIRRTQEVLRRWGRPDVEADLADQGKRLLTIMHGQRIVGAVQWYEEDDPDYRHAGIDIYVDPAVHGCGLGTDTVRAVARFLIEERGHHRLVIDPAADNHAAIRCYEKAGFRPVGVMRRYERGPDGTWHDGLLMDLLAEELTG